MVQTSKSKFNYTNSILSWNVPSFETLHDHEIDLIIQYSPSGSCSVFVVNRGMHCIISTDLMSRDQRSPYMVRTYTINIQWPVLAVFTCIQYCYIRGMYVFILLVSENNNIKNIENGAF